MACLDKCKDLDVVLLAGLTAKSAPRTSLAHQDSLRQQLPYLHYCCEQPNCCLLLTQAPSTRIYSLIHSNITELATLQVASDKLLPVGQQRPKEWDCHVLSRRLVFTLKRRELNSNFQKNVRQKQMITLTISHIPNPSICFHLHSAHNSVGRKGDREWCATMNSRTK